MNDNQSSKLKNFLVNGFQGLEPREDEYVVESADGDDAPEYAEEVEQIPAAEEDETAEVVSQPDPQVLEELRLIREALNDIRSRQAPDLGQYMTTREQNKKITESIAKLDSSSTNKALVRAMEQISTMREDFFKLCEEMRAKIDDMDPRTVLSSFEAYEVDMENILTDAGVYIGKFEFDKLNTLHQRIVGVVPTGEKEKDGTIAERQTDGYKLGDKVLVKEKVTVYKFDQSLVTEDVQVETASETDLEIDSETPLEMPSETDSEMPSETPLETTSDNASEGSDDSSDPAGTMEEKE